MDKSSQSGCSGTFSGIDSVIDRGECEFVSQIAHQFPVNIFMMLVNGPQSDRDLLVDMAERYMHSPKAEDRAKGFQDLVNYLTSFIEQRRKTPGEDLVSLILKGQILGKPLTDEELAGCVILVFLAGLDTVAAMLTFITQYLARHPDKYKELVDDPNRIPNVIEELIRVSGVAVIERGVRNDIDYNGIPFRKFDRITFVTPLAGLDDKDVKDPTNVDFNRTVSRHMAFGWGPHHCIGSHLARVEIRTFLEEWTKRIPKFSVRKDAHISVAGGSSWVPNQLPLIWERVRVPA